MLVSGGSARCSPEKRKLIFLPIRLLYQISWSVVKKFTKFLDCKSNFSIFSDFCKSCISWKMNFKGGIARRGFYCSNGMFLGKTVFHIRQKGVPPLLLPASVLQSPRCLVWIYNLFLILQLYLNLKVSKNAIAAEKPYCKFSICFANVGYSPTPRQHFWKIAGSKNFLLPAAHHSKPWFFRFALRFLLQFYSQV